MKKSLTLFALAATFSFGAMAADFNGYIIDQSCASKAAMRGNVDCANKCIKGGSPAVLVTEAGKVYKISNQDKILASAGQNVTVTGKLKGDTLTIDEVK